MPYEEWYLRNLRLGTGHEFQHLDSVELPQLVHVELSCCRLCQPIERLVRLHKGQARKR